LDEGKIQDLIDYWQKVLNLESWRIQYKIKPELSDPRALMQFVPTRDRRIALINIKEDTLSLPPDEFQKLLVHEIWHILLDPIVEEHGDQIKFIETDPGRRKEARIRFIKQLERIVEHAAQATAPLGAATLLIEAQADGVDFMNRLHRCASRRNDPVKIMVDLLETICQEYGWEVGHVLRYHPAHELLKSTGAWYIAPGYEEFYETNIEIPIGHGMGGKVWETRQTAYLSDIGNSEHFLYAANAKKTGLNTAMMAPIIGSSSEAPVGVIQLFSAREDLPTAALLFDVLEQATSLIARILERMDYQDNILSQMRRFETLAETAVDGICVCDQWGDITYVNAALARMSGYSKSELLHTNFSMLLPPEFRGKHSKMFRSYVVRRQDNSRMVGRAINVKMYRKDSSLFATNVSLSTFETEDEGLFFTAIFRDIEPGKRKTPAAD
jgi:PAS domain S-box-containing protein